MASLGSVVVQFLADDKMSKTVGKITGGLRDLNKKTDDTDSRMGKLSGTMKAGLAAGAAVAGGALIGLGSAMIAGAKAAIEDNKEARKLADTLATIPGVTQKMIDANAGWIDSMELATSVADSDLRDAVSKLALATGDLTKAQDLTTIAVDAAAGSGKSLSGIVDALAKAQDGNTAALKRQFPWLDKNKDGTVTLDEAVKGLSGAYKDTAKNASNRDPWQKLLTIWDQLKEQLSQWVIPLIDEFGDWFKDKKNQKAIAAILEQIGDLSRELGLKLVPALEKFLTWAGSEKGRQDIREFATSLGKFATAIMSIARAFGQIAGAWNRLPAPIRKLLLGGPGLFVDWVTSGGQSAGSWSAAPASAGPATMASGPSVAGPPIFVTEDMVAQAVSNMMMRSAGRRGRLVMVS